MSLYLLPFSLSPCPPIRTAPTPATTCAPRTPGQTVRLAGWIHNKRDLGGVLFIDLRDHYGITQIVIPPTAAFQDDVAHLPKETVISVEGNVRPRPEAP